MCARPIELNTLKLAQERQQAEKARLDATAKETEREMTRLEKRTAELSGKIEHWLSDYNVKKQSTLDRVTLRKLLAHPVEWIVEERETLSAIERAVARATSVLDERTRQLTQHEQRRPSDEPLDRLKQIGRAHV